MSVEGLLVDVLRHETSGNVLPQNLQELKVLRSDVVLDPQVRRRLVTNPPQCWRLRTLVAAVASDMTSRATSKPKVLAEHLQ